MDSKPLRKFLLLTFMSLPLHILTHITAIDGQNTNKLNVKVYYETLCPDSKRFVKRQLYPLLQKDAAEHVDVEFIPYGKATTTLSGSQYSFSCQHGEAECNGNRMHACAIKYLSKSDTMHFIGCSMGKSYPPNSLHSCAADVGIDTGTRDKISACSKSEEGDQLLAAAGQATHSLRPKLFFVPTVTYNNEFNSEKMWQSQDNFHGVICKELSNAPKFCK